MFALAAVRWELIKDIVVATNGLWLISFYAFDDGFAVYPLTALMLAAVWGALGWNGISSLAATAVVVLGLGAAIAARTLRGKKLVEQRPRSWTLAAIVLGAGFAGSFVVGIVVALSTGR